MPRRQARLAKRRCTDALSDMRKNGVKVGQFVVAEVLCLSGKQCPERERRFCQRLVDGIAKEVLFAVCAVNHHHGVAAVAVRQRVQRTLLASVARKRAEHGKGAFDVYAAVVLEEGKQLVEENAAGDLCRDMRVFFFLFADLATQGGEGGIVFFFHRFSPSAG